MRLIDVDELIGDLVFPNQNFKKVFIELLYDAPTIDPLNFNISDGTLTVQVPEKEFDNVKRVMVVDGYWGKVMTENEKRKKGKFLGTEYDGYADGNPVYYEWECSECGCVFEDEEPTWNFCPNCGADMRGEEE